MHKVFLTLTDESGGKIRINVNRINYIRPRDEYMVQGFESIINVGGAAIYVQESPDTIQQILIDSYNGEK